MKTFPWCLCFGLALMGQSLSIGQSGFVDVAFSAESDGPVYVIALQPDGKILIGGAFHQINGIGRTNIARLNADGSLDHTWTAGAAEFVHQIHVETNGKIYVASGDGVTRRNSSGAVEQFYAVFARTIAVDASGGLIAGGTFTFVNGEYHRRIARFHENGSLDPAFVTEVGCCAGESVEVLLRQGDQFLIGGLFQEINQTNRYYHFARIDADGAVDSSFQGYANGRVVGLAFHPDGRIYRVNERALARHLADGLVDDSFPLVPAGVSFDDQFYAVASQADGKAIVAGNFTLDHGATHLRLARFHENGTQDSAFVAEPNERVEALAIQPDGRILVVGHFTSINGIPRSRIARLLGDEPIIERTRVSSSNQLVLSWPSAYTNHVLQSCTSFSTGDWMTVSNATVTSSGGMNRVTNEIASSGAKFFRLMKP